MELQTINQVSKEYGISTRMLRYYEQIGLLESLRKEDYAYRVYDETALRRLQQIIILRKLRIPVKQIGVILSEPKAAEAIEIFKQNISELDDEINALSVIKNILTRLATELRKQAHIRLEIDTLMDSSVLSIVNSLSLSKNYIKESTTVDLKKADEKLNKLTDKDIRIIYLPSMTVASIHIVGQDRNGEHAEYTAAIILDEFIKNTNLKMVYPAARSFGFNNPDGIPDEDPTHGFERWISIPDDMEVPAPLVKKHLDGGMYAAHVIPFGAWDDGWMPLYNWIDENNDRYVGRWSTIDGVCGWIEEHLNYWDWNDNYDGKAVNQVDLLMPIKPRFAAGTRHPQERIIETFNYNGIPVEVVEWDATIWCGKIGYAKNNTDEPEVDKILNGFMALPIPSMNERIEPNWDVCMSVNYLSKERPNGVMFADLVGTENQPEGFDVYKLPTGQYLRLAINDDSAKAFGSHQWNGGIPPYEWVGEQLAPQFGYEYGNDILPMFEYYGYYKPDKNAHEFRYLYVPVQKKLIT